MISVQCRGASTRQTLNSRALMGIVRAHHDLDRTHAAACVVYTSSYRPALRGR